MNRFPEGAESTASLVSVVVPCYKGEKYLAGALESCLLQDWPNIEIIVVNDASPDACLSIALGTAARDSRVKVMSLERNLGVAGAFNVGFNAALGLLLTRLAQDDLFLPGAIRRLAGKLATCRELDCVYGDMELIDGQGRRVGEYQAWPAEKVLRGGFGMGVCWMFRRQVWERENRGFDSDFDQVEDFEYWMRASQHSRLGKVEGPPLLQFRQHDQAGSTTHSARMEVLTARVIARHSPSLFAARRALAAGHFNAAWIHRSNEHWAAARTHAVWAALLHPTALRYWRSLVATLLYRWPP